jgi:hypothetical protein
MDSMMKQNEEIMKKIIKDSNEKNMAIKEMKVTLERIRRRVNYMTAFDIDEQHLLELLEYSMFAKICDILQTKGMEKIKN